MTNVHLHVTRARGARCADGSGYMHVPVFIYQYVCGGRDPRGRSRLTHGAGAGSARPVTYDAQCACTRPRPFTPATGSTATIHGEDRGSGRELT